MELRIALCQCDIAWEQPARNLARLEPMVAAAEADVVLLPELFATGFTLDPAGVADGAGGAVVTALRRWAARYGKAVAGSVAVTENGRFYNRMYFVKPSGEFIGYDKRHLFAPGGEARQYTPGGSRAVVEYGGVVPAARLLRFAFSGLEPLPGRLRRHSVLRLVACAAARSVADAAARPGHRKPVLCSRGESGGG